MNVPQTMPLVTTLLATAATYFGDAVALALLAEFGGAPSNWSPTSHPTAREITFLVSAALFVISSILVLLRPRRGYAVALLSGLIAISCLAWGEFSNFYWGNTWIGLNEPGLRQAAAWLTILTAVLASVSACLSALRLLPERWIIRGLPLRQRTWPAFGISGLILVVWFGYSVTPYRLPGNAHGGVYPNLRILHVEKSGLQFHETEVAVFKDGKFGVWRVNRRLFEYRFTMRGLMGVMPEALKLRALAFAHSLTERAPTPSPGVLRTWQADGWYVVGSGLLLNFTGEHRSAPPRELVDLFEDVAGLGAMPGGEIQAERRDVCLGFCYGPVAALGFVHQNHHCTIDDGAVRCP